MHKHHHGVDEARKSGDQQSGRGDTIRIVRDTLIAIPENVDGASLRHGHLNWRMLQVRSLSFFTRALLLTSPYVQDEQLAIYATASIALSHIAFKIDQIHSIVRSLVGEQRFNALEDLSRERATRDAQWLDKA